MGYCKFSKFDLLTLIMVFYAAHSENAAQIMNDRVSLLSFVSGITHDPENALWSWKREPSDNGDSSVCSWSGVECAKNRVVELNLSHKHLRGIISPALFDLSQLAVLDLSGNFFEGRIPAEIGALRHLKELSLSSNLLEGLIPPEVGFLRQLVYLNLGNNRFVGEIPESIFCSGSSSLQYLDLSNNSLSGEIPLKNQCELRELRYLLLWSNHLVGEVPFALSNSTMLEWLDLESNQLTGELPSQILTNLPQLKFLYLSYNRFSSHNNENLEPFFASLVNSTNLQEIDLAANYLRGELPSVIGNLSSLVQINLYSNLIYGPIPPQISNLVNLTLLNLSSNLLNGTIPSQISLMGKLERLFLSNNSLSGQIPSAFGKMHHLGLLDLSNNKLSGTIPEAFSNLVQLRRLLLYENELVGPIPPTLGKCVNLEVLDLSHNRITGTIPSEVIAGLSSLKLYLNLSSNFLHGRVPLEMSKMDMVLAVDLSSNNLSNTLPAQLSSCVALEYLNVSRNSFEGKFPAPIGNLPYLKELDVSFNFFTGEIPESLQHSPNLKVLNFSYNDFSGNISNRGAFAHLRADSFIGNENLCGSIKGMKSCRRRQTRHFLVAILLSLIITPIFCIVGYPLFLRSNIRKQLLPVLNPKTKAVRDLHPDEDEEATKEERKYPRISRRQLIEATEGFSKSNLIGSGRFGHVYKGILRDNITIAVKVLSSKSSVDLISSSFKRECQVLKRTRHRNLIRIITACSGPDFKALVLPLMANGSLEGHLYPGQYGPVKNGLDLVRVVGICSDVAEGMAYLHHYAPVRVVHCDLKPSNILLDDNMTALVTDFGIARLVRGADESLSGVNDSASYDSTDGLLCGSVGYIAPEYGMGRHASPEGDVYSYGVLILEIITGKRPTNVLFQEGSSMHEWVKSQYPHKLEPIVEEAIARCSPHAPGPWDRKTWSDVILELIELGLMCTQHNPGSRPSMLDVAHEVSLLKQYLVSSPSSLLIEESSTD